MTIIEQIEKLRDSYLEQIEKIRPIEDGMVRAYALLINTEDTERAHNVQLDHIRLRSARRTMEATVMELNNILHIQSLAHMIKKNI